MININNRRKTPKKIARVILQTLDDIGGWVLDDPWDIRMLTSKIIHERKEYISESTVYEYLKNSKSIELKDGVFILRSRRRR